MQAEIVDASGAKTRKEIKDFTISDLYHVSAHANNNFNKVQEAVKTLGTRLNRFDKKLVNLEERLIGRNSLFIEKRISLNEVEKDKVLEDKLAAIKLEYDKKLKPMTREFENQLRVLKGDSLTAEVRGTASFVGPDVSKPSTYSRDSATFDPSPHSTSAKFPDPEDLSHPPSQARS